MCASQYPNKVLKRAGCRQTWVILEPINSGGDDGPTKLIIHVDRSIWVDIRKSKERLQLFNGTTAIKVDPVHLTVPFIRITATVSDSSQHTTCLVEKAESAFGGSSTSGNHAPSFYRLSIPTTPEQVGQSWKADPVNFSRAPKRCAPRHWQFTSGIRSHLLLLVS